jgi:N-acetylneuraminic acid mutarotase
MVFGAAFAAFAAAAACSDSFHLDPEQPPPPSDSTASTGPGAGGGGGSAPACASNSDCPAPTAVCDTVKQQCVECLEIDHCGFRPGTVCSEGLCVCPKQGATFCEPYGGALARCVDLMTSSDDCGACSHACFGACNAGKCADAWEPTSMAGAPSPRSSHSAVWDGKRMIVWGGDSPDGPQRTGGMYDPVTRLWQSTSTANAPSARFGATAVWTDTKMVVWGGNNGGALNTGGVFDPVTNTWQVISLKDAPSSRGQHTAVWTGTKVLIWGGYDGGSNLATGGAYDPATDAWTPISTSNAPSQRRAHTAVWTGSRMIIFGGFGFDPAQGIDNVYLANGAEYDPAMDQWTALQPIGQPSPRQNHTAVWTGTEMLVWGGDASGAFAQDGSKYSVQQVAWTPMNGPFPEGRALHTALWIGDKMIVWGGYNGNPLNSGGLYSPSSNSWDPKGMPTALTARYNHTAVAAGTKMIVWGGYTPSGFTNTGGVFDPGFTAPVP